MKSDMKYQGKFTNQIDHWDRASFTTSAIITFHNPAIFTTPTSDSNL